MGVWWFRPCFKQSGCWDAQTMRSAREHVVVLGSRPSLRGCREGLWIYWEGADSGWIGRVQGSVL